MEQKKTKAVVDADFFIKLTEYDDKHATLFLKVMDDLNIQPVMHAYVAKKEIKSFPAMESLIQDGKIIVLDYEEYITDDNQQDYQEYFEDAFEQMNRYDFPEGEDIYTYDCEDESLGEIRSIYMAKVLKYPYFMSDDGNAKRLANRNSTSKSKITTWNIFEVLKQCKQRGTSINLKLLNPTISNVFRDRQNQLKELQQMYGE